MRLLVIEENKKVATFLARALDEDGHVVDMTSDGRTGLSQAGILRYDTIIVDWASCGMDGRAFIGELRSRGRAAPILILTALKEVEDRIAGLNAGADDYMCKPFDAGELLARVRALTRRANGAHGTLFHVGTLMIDRSERKTIIGDRSIDLSPKEFALLSYLMGEAGRTVSRSELLTNVWNASFDPGSNIIEVQIKKLRNKLGIHAGMVETIRGVGYRLNVFRG